MSRPETEASRARLVRRLPPISIGDTWKVRNGATVHILAILADGCGGLPWPLVRIRLSDVSGTEEEWGAPYFLGGTLISRGYGAKTTRQRVFSWRARYPGTHDASTFPGAHPNVQLLKDPRWQKKRLQILERDGWECVDCGSKEKTLHVHHQKYERGKAPWEVSDNFLETLCEDCHEEITWLDGAIKDALSFCAKSIKYTLLGVLDGAVRDRFSHHRQMPFHVRSHEHAEGVGCTFGLSAEEVIELIDSDRKVTAEKLREAGLRKRKRRTK